jgi:hypothetical protein
LLFYTQRTFFPGFYLFTAPTPYVKPKKKFEWGSADSSGRNVRKGAWQWYDGGKRKGPLSVAERVTQLRKTRSKKDLAIEKAVEVARRLQKAAMGRNVPKVGHARVFQPGQVVWFASVDKPLLRFQGKVVRLWESARPSSCGSSFWIVERNRRDLKEDRRRGKYVAVLPQNAFPL